MRITTAALLCLAAARLSLAAPQDAPDITEVRSLLQQAAALVPDIEEAQRGSLTCNVSGQQVRAGDTAAALATIQLLPKGLSRDISLFCSAGRLAAGGNWQAAIQTIDSLSESTVNSSAYAGVAFQLAQRGDYENALTVARLILKGPEKSRFVDVAVQIYAKQVKAGDTAGAARTLAEALRSVDQSTDTPTPDVAARYANLVQLASAGGSKAASPLMERLYQVAIPETEPGRRQQILGHMAISEAALGDFAAARRSADQLAPGDQRDKVLVIIAIAQARQGDPAGAQLLAGNLSPKAWDATARQQFGSALAASGDYLGALSIIEKIQKPDDRAQALGLLALDEAQRSQHWALLAAQMAQDLAQSTGDSKSFALQSVAVTRGILGDFSGAMQVVNQLAPSARQWPLWNLTEQLVAAGRKNDALALANAQDDPFPRAYGYLGIASALLK
jgi:hypothetical protein